MSNNLNLDMKKLCDLQIELWGDMKRDLMTMEDPTDEDIIIVFRKHLRETHHNAILQLIKVKSEINQLEEIINFDEDKC